MKIGEVRTFPKENLPDFRTQALKIMEEAAEVFSQFDNSWTQSETSGKHWIDAVCHECADVIMATCNLLARLDIEDFTTYMNACELGNERRGRYDIQG